MKIRFSDKIRSNIPNELLNQIVHLTFSIIPFEKLQFFIIDVQNDKLLMISHIIPARNYFQTLFITNSVKMKGCHKIASIKIDDTIYLLYESEFKNIFK